MSANCTSTSIISTYRNPLATVRGITNADNKHLPVCVLALLQGGFFSKDVMEEEICKLIINVHKCNVIIAGAHIAGQGKTAFTSYKWSEMLFSCAKLIQKISSRLKKTIFLNIHQRLRTFSNCQEKATHFCKGVHGSDAATGFFNAPARRCSSSVYVCVSVINNSLGMLLCHCLTLWTCAIF